MADCCALAIAEVFDRLRKIGFVLHQGDCEQRLGPHIENTRDIAVIDDREDGS